MEAWRGWRAQSFSVLPEPRPPARGRVVLPVLVSFRVLVLLPPSLRRGFSVQLDAVLLQLRAQQGVVIFQLLNLNNSSTEVMLRRPSCQTSNRLHRSHTEELPPLLLR